jgi:hypothetical protein
LEKFYKYPEQSKNVRNIFSQNKILFIVVGTNLYEPSKIDHNNGTVIFLAIYSIGKIPLTLQPTNKFNSNSAQSGSNKNTKEQLRSCTLYSFFNVRQINFTCISQASGVKIVIVNRPHIITIKI